MIFPDIEKLKSLVKDAAKDELLKGNSIGQCMKF
jgi:hypothetical protein